MKHLILLIALIIIGASNAHSQKSYTCSFITYSYWNQSLGDYEELRAEMKTIEFSMNDSETIFFRKNGKELTLHYVDKKEVDPKSGLYNYYMHTNDKVKFIYIFDEKNKVIKSMFTENEKPAMTSYDIEEIN